MLQTKTNLISNGFERRYTVTTIDDIVIKQAEKIFNKYNRNKVILNNDFSNNVWRLTDQIKTVSFNFEYSNINFHKYAAPWIGCSYLCFLNTTKAYAILNLGYYSLLKIQDITRDFHNLIKYSYEEIINKKHTFTEYSLELLRMLPQPCRTRDSVIESIEEINTHRIKNKNQRSLADFKSYFNFHNTMQDFWNNASNKLMLQYFPLRMWWILTSILPLRATEFLLTPRKCLEYKNNNWILTVRRTMLKGGYRKKSYRIDDDYELKKYVITQSMANEILSYLDLTKDMCQSKLDTLFVQEPHNILVGQNVMNENRYYSYANLSTCLKKFQENYMHIKEHDGNIINLGDTRHIAMINLIISGGSPVICKELAGHSDINISSHYFSNISKFIECATYETYKKSLNNSAILRTHRSKILKSNAVKLNNGYCDSTKYREGSVDDCLKHMSVDGEIGYCPECPYFIDDKHGMYIVFEDIAKRRKQVDEDSKRLMEAIDNVRRGIGYSEDIQSALMRLQYSSTWYSKCLQKDLEVNNNGETT